MTPFAMPQTLASFTFIPPAQRVVIHSAITHQCAAPAYDPEIESSSSSHRHISDESERFLKLCNDLKVGPSAVSVRLETNNATGIRGLYPNSNLKEGDIILSLPLSSCLRDDEPPSWLKSQSPDEEDSDDDDTVQWPTRLTASLVDLQLRERGKEDNDSGKSIWLDMLPDPNLLRASLPMHWSEDIISSTKSVGLEMAVDMVYFARANAIPDLMSRIRSSDLNDAVKDFTEEELERFFQDAFDVIQTRCCAVDHPTSTDTDGPRRLRLLAPVFDFLNHGTGCFPYPGSPNAMYESTVGDDDDNNGKEPLLVVRATKDIMKNQEILIDYGESAHTAWKCLGSYGFVPNYEIGDERSTAELYVDNTRAEVGGDSVPFELIEAASKALDLEMDENGLSPAVALRIAEKAFDFADDLSVEDESLATGGREDEAYSLSLAASLRKYQSKVLRKWAFGLKQFAAEQCMEEY